MKVAITGPNGWIAKALDKKFEQEHINSIKISRSSLSERHIPHESTLRTALLGCQSIVHLAALVHHQKAPPSAADYQTINCDLTLELAQIAASCGVKQFIFVSTAKVMGEQSNKPFLESDPAHPTNAYSISKFNAETGLRKLSENGKLGSMKICIVRPPLVYGEGVGANYEKLISLARTRWPLPLGRATALRSMVSIVRLTNGIVALTRTADQLKGFEVFFAADPEDQSAAKIIHSIRQAKGYDARLIAVPPALMQSGLSLIGRRSIYDRLFTSLQVDGARLNALIEKQSMAITNT
jgi:nucleoside-diphosphate-sugar epimerase